MRQLGATRLPTRVFRGFALASALTASGCWLNRPAPSTPPASPSGELLPDVRTATGRPPVVLVAREGDPAIVLAVAITTTGIGWGDANAHDPEPAAALAGLLESRLRAKGLDFVVTPSWDGVRASGLTTDATEATRLAQALHDTLLAPAGASDLEAARRKLVALGRRPLRDRMLARWARCVGEPHALPERAGKDYADVDVARLERWRAAAIGTSRLAIAVTATPAVTESVAAAILQGPEWKPAAPIPADTSTNSVEVLETAPDLSSVPTLHLTLDVRTGSAAVATAEALGDPAGPLAARLLDLDLPFRLREVTGTAHARGGCVGAILEASPSPQASASADLAGRVADAVALVSLEAEALTTDRGSGVDPRGSEGLRDGRALARRSGDAREAAERAAWWALGDQTSSAAGGLSVVLSIPSRRSVKEPAPEPSSDTLAQAIARAQAGWRKPVIEARSRIESGQGEAWILVGSPCGTDGETDTDAGLTALFVTAAAESAKASGGVRVEPWVAAGGAGLLVHGPALAGEAPAAHARRLADIGARGFAAEPIPPAAIGRARADLLRRDAHNDGTALSILAGALAPRDPSWIIPWGASEPLARSSDGAVRLRAQSLRAGPLRVAVLANTDASQADAAVRAADRWVARRSGETRACRAPFGAEPPKPGTYASAPRPGSVPEAYLAFPLPPGDERTRNAATLVAAALSDGENALLEKALLEGPAPLARETSARVLGWPRAPALVIRIVAPHASLDGAVMQARALIDRLHGSALATPDFDRATAARAHTALTTSLDPRARVVATWRGEPISSVAPFHVTAEDVRSFAQKYLAEDAMVVVAVRPPRPPATPGTP